jgi:hypothetical protein
MANQLVKGYVDAALTQLKRRGQMRWPGKLPDSMRDTSIPASKDWIGWKPVTSTATDAELDALEKETKLPFPPAYRDFLQYLHFVGLTETGIRFETHLCSEWREKLRRAYFQSWPRERILDIGLLPFGDESQMDAGPVCFDTRSRLQDGDCPVVFWDHEWSDTEKEIRPMFSSSAKMFECLTFVAQTDFNFIHHGNKDEPTVLVKKQQALARFLALDPKGAGETAKDYWTCWGVCPAA